MQGKGNRTRITADCSDDCTAYVVTADANKIKEEAGKIGEADLNNVANIEAKRKFCRFKCFVFSPFQSEDMERFK